ncbi:aldo/keto reductase [Flavobacterium frigoris]|uniref:Oxidoreductase n=1 Tax=Flavobacterium frigoris (strain PS1) TaxID=1086011 RepID=H7FS87_FLAFP|nr:aldo/keto reductase [Flavobacterium frigoris]EIA08584.1 oxidoreductase [Flavobacterium frigoris PS1]
MIKTKIGIGLAALGRPEYINIRENKSIDKSEKAFRENAFKVLDFAYESGVRYFDTAPSYGKGERYLIDWKTERKHSDIILSTKWGYTYVANWELGYKGKHEVKEHSLDKLLEQWEVSQLLLPELKIYQIHSATLESGVLQNEAVLNQLHQIKKQTNVQIGISSSGVNQKEIMLEALNVKVENEYLFDSFQVTYNILEQSSLEVLNTLKSKNKTIIIKEALANGRIFNQENKAVYSLLDTLSKKYNVGIDAIAIRFVIESIEPDFVLSGASNTKQLEQNLKALNKDLSFTAVELNQLKLLRRNPKSYWDERSRLTWD